MKIIGVVQDIKANGDYWPAGNAMFNRTDTSDLRHNQNILIKVSEDANAAFESELYQFMTSTFKNSTIGIEHLTGIDKSNFQNEFTDVFFFSSQTFTTVGYGRIAPVGFLASLVATFEAFLGLLAFAIATGLFYGRFSRPRAFLQFSDVALISPHKDKTGLMFRMAPFKNTSLTDASITVLTSFEITENGQTKSSFYNLKLEVTKITSLILNWTIVHYIDEESPFYGLNAEDLKNTDIEIIVHVKAFDSIFSSDVVQRTSYTSDEIVYGARFEKMYGPDETNRFTILNLDLINNTFPASLPEIS